MSNITSSPVSYNKYEQKRADQLNVTTLKRKPDSVNNPRYGTITEVRKDPTQTFVYVQFDDVPPNEFSRDTTGVPMPLAHTIEEIALVFGDELVGLKCKLESIGGDINVGLIYIIDTVGSGNLEAANKLPGFNTIFAPAGNLSI
jgi:hypothetical protein